MKKGFTLVELLGTITILGVIMLIVSPIARNIIESSKEELYEVQVVNIEDALKNWVVDNSRLLPENEGETITITLGQLKAGGYVEAELRNPKNNKCFGNDMLLTVTRYQKNYIYNVEDESSTETDTCDEYLKPYIILNGDAIVYVEVGEGEYFDLGASAIGTDGADISSSITTSISGSGDTIDTSVVGNNYTITYTVTEGTTTTSIKRKVIVNDTIHPELTIPDNVVLEIGDTSLNLMEGVSAIDNSDSSGSSVNIAAKSNISFGIPGEYTITYIATDSSGNEITKKRIVEIMKDNSKKLFELATTGTFSYEYGNDITVNEVHECATVGTCDVGTAFAIKVNDTDVYKFYVISDDGNEVTLIMDRNLGGKVAWYSDEDATTNNERNNLGPITALNYLNIQTESWDNMPKIKSYIYDNSENGTKKYGYLKLEITRGKSKLLTQDGKIVTEIAGESKARLLTYEEAISSDIGCVFNNVGCEAWMHENLSSANTQAEPMEYWLLSTYAWDPSRGYSIRYDKLYFDFVYNVTNVGIRPVITLSK